MIPITRLAEPRILQEKKVEWTTAFLDDPGKKRPDSSKYAHPEIKQTLRSMSHNKCFYCEAKEAKLTVDHHIEVAEQRDRAFEWANLYLACCKCQDKEPNRSIPASDCLDPCDPNVAPEAHLSFQNDHVKYHSRYGDQTIKKYRLNHPERLLQRRGQLLLFMEVLDRIQQARIDDGGRPMTPPELAELRRFADPDEPFSLMFSCLLRSKALR